jgi:hypothetical protein
MRSDFVAFILSHGRPDSVKTFKTLRRQGYTGKIVLVIDNEDDSVDRYRANFDCVEVFDKQAVADQIDEGDNFQDRRTPTYARNACFEIAEKIGARFFVQLDDDYGAFCFRRGARLEYLTPERKAKNLDRLFSSVVGFLAATPFLAVALSQNGDFIGGKNGSGAKKLWSRKAMNSFFCDVRRKYQTVGRLNDDVNTYVSIQRRGEGAFLTLFQASLSQAQTQKNSGGITELYLASGTYVKSFYTVMFAPSCAKISLMGVTNQRLHHRIDWGATAPKILREGFRKSERPSASSGTAIKEGDE